MKTTRGILLAVLIVPAVAAQGIRGVTRRTPTVVYGQQPAQFFTAGGVPLNTPTNVAAIPGSPNQGLVGRPAPVPANALAGRPAPLPQKAVPPGVQNGRRPAVAPAGQPAQKPR